MTVLPFETSLSFFAAALVLAVAPGPDILLVLTLSTLYGARKGLALTAGLVTGVFWHLGVVAMGVAALLAASPKAFLVLKIIGAAYLAYLAWLTFRSGALKADMKGEVSVPGAFQLFRRGVIMNITNPKVTLFMLAFLPQFCSPEHGSMPLQIFYLGFLFQLSAIIVFSSIAFLGGRLAAWFNRSARAQRMLNLCAALVLAGMAVMLVLF